ncbi:BCCT family transporter [Rubrobacter aplysinae]|uniref:BCCT family transporter n=1 Tax=Rubrobacter aplysinae TaxID=909625 RepID=UPI00069DF61D|nr:BCCT family transporter [Rubrobacter aplysinae]
MGRLQEHFRQHTNPPVFFISAAVAIAFVLWGVLASGSLGTVAGGVFAWIGEYAGWWYMLAASAFLIVALFLAFSKFGSVKMGPDDARPEFGTFAWFSMLFTAGMGIGLVFFGVNEPVSFLTDPAAPVGEPGTAGAAVESFRYTLFHWGLHPWAIYVVLGAALGYFAFRRGLPLRPSSALYPLIGDRIHGSVGNVIDILAVFGTLFGLATSLGLGAGQISAGLSSTLGTPDNVWVQVAVIATLTLIAVGSVLFGIDKGIRRLSLGNLVLAAILAVVVFVVGPTLVILQYFTSGLGNYLQTLPQTSFNMFPGNAAAQEWNAGWTIFYWGWWMSWSPFVGMFIARISYGLTLRKFIVGAMIAPTLASTVWFAIFGGGAMSLVVSGGNQALANADSTSAMFTYLSALPIAGVLATVLSLLAIVVVALFFATSSDSGSLVVDILTNGGDPNPDWKQRLFWAVAEGTIGAILLVAGTFAGGDPLSALQSASVSAGLPFSIVLVLVAIGLLKGLSEERAEQAAPEPGRSATPHPGGARTSGRATAPQQVQQMSSENPTEGGNRSS